MLFIFFFVFIFLFFFYLYFNFVLPTKKKQKHKKHKVKERENLSARGIRNQTEKKTLPWEDARLTFFLMGFLSFQSNFDTILIASVLCVLFFLLIFYSIFERDNVRDIEPFHFVRNAWLNVNEIIIIPKWEIKTQNVYLSDLCCELWVDRCFVVKEGNCVLESNREHCSPQERFFFFFHN